MTTVAASPVVDAVHSHFAEALLRRSHYQTNTTYRLDVVTAVRERLRTRASASMCASAADVAGHARSRLNPDEFETVARQAHEQDLFETLDRALAALAAGAPVS